MARLSNDDHSPPPRERATQQFLARYDTLRPFAHTALRHRDISRQPPSHRDLVEILARMLRAVEPDDRRHDQQDHRDQQNAATNDQLPRSQTETNGHNTAPTRNATAQEKPLPTPRIRVGYISAV